MNTNTLFLAIGMISGCIVMYGYYESMVVMVMGSIALGMTVLVWLALCCKDQTNNRVFVL